MEKIHCCDYMEKAIAKEELALQYIPDLKVYNMLLKTNFKTSVSMYYCPWCGVAFQNNLENFCAHSVELDYDELDEIRTNRLTGKEKQFLQWNYDKGEVESYDFVGKYQGALHPKSGEKTSNPDRRKVIKNRL